MPLKNKLYSIIILLIYLFTCIYIYNSNKTINIKSSSTTKSIEYIENTSNNIKVDKKNNSNILGKLSIPKININSNLYNINSKLNNVEKNITILKGSTLPDLANSTIIIAAHSGTGKVAYFKNLDLLKIDDKVYLYYNKTKYIYKVTKIWEEEKNGYIHINKNNKTNQLILTTCSPNHDEKQLIVNSILVEKKEL